MAGLSRELLAHKASFVLPVDTLCMELQTIADAYSEAGGSVRHALIAFVLFVLFFLLLRAISSSGHKKQFCFFFFYYPWTIDYNNMKGSVSPLLALCFVSPPLAKSIH